jgi:hypothetical protein
MWNAIAFGILLVSCPSRNSVVVLSISCAVVPGAWLLDNGQCVTLASTPTAIAAPAVFWFRSVSFYPTNVTAATLCTATLESPSTPGAVSPQVAFELKLSCTSNSNWWRAVITNMTSNWGSARVAVSRAAGDGVSAVNLYAAISSATYVPVSATILAVAALSFGCTKSEPLVVTPPTPVGVISYQASIATNASVCLSVLRLDGSTLVVRSFPSGSAPATSVANETLYLVYPSVAGLEISQTFTAYHTVDGGATFTLSYVNLVSTPTTAIFFTNYSNHVYAPQTSAFCANVEAPTWALPSRAFVPPFIVTGQLTIANRISQTYPHYLFNTSAGSAARIVWPVNYLTQLSQLLGIFPYRFAAFSLSTLTASVSSSVIDYRITADPWAGESTTWTDSTVALVTQLNSWQARGALGPMAILSPNSTAVAPAPVLLWRCADGVTYLTTCVPASVVNATPTPAPAKALTSVRMSLAMTVQAAFDLTFQSAFKTALAGFLGIPVLRISIGSVESGSAIIQVVILPPPTDATATGANALSSLQLSNVLVAAASNPSSPLFTAVAANTQVTLNLGASLFLSVLCPDGSYQAICSVPNVTIAPVTPAPAFFPVAEVPNPALLVIGAIVCAAAVVAAAAYYCHRKRAEMQAQRDFEMSNRNKQY